MVLDWTSVHEVFPETTALHADMYADGFFNSAPLGEWVFLVVMVVLMLMTESALLKRYQSRTAHVLMVALWILAAAMFCAHYTLVSDAKGGAEWLLGYMLEVILSIDNVFVFHLMFETFRPPPEQQHKAMCLGVVGALLSRLALFLMVGTVLHAVRWVRGLLGLFLIYAGARAASEDGQGDPSELHIVRALRWCLGPRLLLTYDSSGRMFVVDEAGRLCATMLLPLVLAVEVTDVFFAMDSLSAKIAQIPNQFTSFSSSAFAILALRASFFVLRDLVDYFGHLKYGFCIILVFIGFELLFADYVKLKPSTLCILISAVFVTSMVSSVRAKMFPAEAYTAPAAPS